MSSTGWASEAVGIELEAVGAQRDAGGANPSPERVGGVAVKEAAALLGMPVSTMYDWVNRRWVRTIAGLSERGKEQRLVPWSEIERLKGGAKETLLEQSGRKLDSGSGSEPTGSGSEAAESEPEPAGREPAATGSEPQPHPQGSRNPSESVGIDWKLVARAEARRVRDHRSWVQFLEAHLARAEARAEKTEARAEREGHELRILMAQGVAAQQQTAAALNGIEERLALPAPESRETGRRARWMFWRR